MINGDVNLFLEELSQGFEVIFLYNHKKYFAQGMSDGENFELMVDQWEPIPPDTDYIWRKKSKGDYDIKAFENAPIFDGKSFWEIQEEIEWVDC